MVEIRDGKKVLTTPISAEDLKDIHIGDIVYLTGSLTTCRDVAHRRVVEEGQEIPVDVRNNAILHAGPIIRPLEGGKFEMVSVGPTTSMRMEKFEYDFVKTTGVRVIVGKGGMRENTQRACKEGYSLRIPRRKRCGRCCGGRGDCQGRVAGPGYARNPVELPGEGVRAVDRLHRQRGTQLF